MKPYIITKKLVFAEDSNLVFLSLLCSIKILLTYTRINATHLVVRIEI